MGFYWVYGAILTGFFGWATYPTWGPFRDYEQGGGGW